MRPVRDLLGVPERAVLLLQQDDGAIGEACFAPRVVQEHQRQEPVHLGLVGHELGERASEPDGFAGQLVPAAVPLVEDQVDHREDCAQAIREQVGRRYAEWDACGFDLPLRAHESLRHRLVGDEERARDLLRRETSERTERQRDLRVE